MTDKTGNHRLRPPIPPITRSMADAGKTVMAELLAKDNDEVPISDDILVAEVFIAMWIVMQEQAMKARIMAVKGMDSNNVLVMPKAPIIRPL